ncbi:biotin--[acetyl-CoA-carboxylase] ligase [Amylibacter ulvae]|uniref:biotin--[biotin carboxyl-carrier protein] ligase n=1 Tax=Paramylibacter ulvae TaxID=1651968 RepID=A0ABQ3D6R2_9RHOB|nr:biotin--[acetyl-CoA-carboxylase] ligase [Amylibacter ulvae]GHA53526.1 biotin--[acetyl-CoA-carboxylase] ligase [Amylibacter ulvae]
MNGWPTGVGRRVFDTIDSTNIYARAIVNDGASPVWIMAHEQTDGVGRRGRAWSTQRGNFAATYLADIKDDLNTVALRSFVAALALYDALIDVGVSADRLSLKWPNDVLLDGGKVAGILLETAGVGPSHICIGIGVNLAHAPEPDKMETTATPAKSLLGDVGLNISAERFLDALAPAYDARETQFRANGFDSTRSDWLAHAARLGETIVARTPKGDTVGTFETLDQTGAVILQTAKGRCAIHAAEIFFT